MSRLETASEHARRIFDQDCALFIEGALHADWIGTPTRFILDNIMSDSEASALSDSLAWDGVYFGGGGASPLWELRTMTNAIETQQARMRRAIGREANP